ncbi:MAG TPA: hypothetical protein VH619_05375 [Verrucomicrobiae bacterium]|jgi:hypothetical protein|nr:hypothetical protein [Verrucomicrobiae bacterium]
MIKIIRQVCKKAGCQPKDLIVEWTPAKGARLIGTSPNGAKTYLNVLARLDHIAQAIYLCANNQEHLYPRIQQQQAEMDARLKECMAENVSAEKIDEGVDDWQECLPESEVKIAIERDWHQLKTARAILRAFPKRPTSDDLIDLYQRNKALNSQELKALLSRHCR